SRFQSSWALPSKPKLPPPGSERRVKLQHGAGAGPALDQELGRASRTTWGVDDKTHKLSSLVLQLDSAISLPSASPEAEREHLDPFAGHFFSVPRPTPLHFAFGGSACRRFDNVLSRSANLN